MKIFRDVGDFVTRGFKNLRNAVPDELPLLVTLTMLLACPACLTYRPAGVFHFASAKLALALLQSLAYAYVACLIVSNAKWRKPLRWAFVCLAALMCFIEFFCFLQLGSRFNSQSLFLMLQTDTREAGEFLSQYLLQTKTAAALLITLAIAATYPLSNRLIRFMGRKSKQSTGLAVIIILPFSIAANILPSKSLYFFDFRSTPLQLAMAVSEIGDTSQEIADLRLTTERLTVEPVGEHPANIVLVVGESFNKHHASIYGYDKETTPIARQEANRGNLLIFDNMMTRSAATGHVLHEVFSTDILAKGESWGKSPLLVSVFDKGGYRVHLFDNHASKQNTSDWDFSSSYFHNPDFIDSSFDVRNDRIFEYDAAMTDYLAENVDVTQGPNFVIVHLIGQHMPARNRYPADFTIFRPEDYASSYSDKQREEIAHYDNATLYNDYVMGRIYDFFRESEGIVIYFSDHGEEVHDFRNQYGRTMEEVNPGITRNIYEIPFMVWMSDSFKNSYPELADRIARSRGRRGYNSDVAQMIMDIGGLSIPQRDEHFDLISRSYIEP